MKGDRQAFLSSAIAGSPNGRGAQGVQTHGDADIVLGRANAVGGIEPDPTQILDPGLCPGVGGVLIVLAVLAAEVARHIAGRNAQKTRRGDENLGVVLAHAASLGEGLGSGVGGGGRPTSNATS